MFELFAAGTLLLLAGLAWATYQSGRLLRSIPIHENLLLAPVENAGKALLVVICAGLGLLSGLRPAALGWTSAAPTRDLALGLVTGLAVQVVANAATLWAIGRFGKQIYSPIVLLNVLPRRRREWLLVPAAMFPAVLLEELLFRSLALGGFGAVVPPWLLVLPLAALFGWMHAPQGALGMIVAAAVSAILSALFLATGSLLAPLIAHYLINLLQLVRAREVEHWLHEY